MIRDSELHPIPTPWGQFGMFAFRDQDFEVIDSRLDELLVEPA